MKYKMKYKIGDKIEFTENTQYAKKGEVIEIIKIDDSPNYITTPSSLDFFRFYDGWVSAKTKLYSPPPVNCHCQITNLVL